MSVFILNLAGGPYGWTLAGRAWGVNAFHPLAFCRCSNKPWRVLMVDRHPRAELSPFACFSELEAVR